MTWRKGSRGPEEELRRREREHEGRGKGKGGFRSRPRANFWVEQDGEWGLMAVDDADALEWLDQALHWVGRDVNAVYASPPLDEKNHKFAEPPKVSESHGFWHQDDDGGHTFWAAAADGDYYHQDAFGTFWAWSTYDEDQAWYSASPTERESKMLARHMSRRFARLPNLAPCSRTAI